jgi:hypothetical protein
MAKLKGIAQELIERLKKEGKVTYFNFTPEEKMKMVEDMRKFKEEDKRRQAASARIARNTFLD